ncbi:hypothetical protein MAH1_21060 [Sessilibacter sp. MAH1]
MTATIKGIYGYGLDISTLDEAVQELYLLAQDMFQGAFSAARIKQNGGETLYPHILEFPLDPEFNAASKELPNGGCAIAINASVPYLIFAACFIYSTSIDVLTGLPKLTNNKLPRYEIQYELIRTLKRLPTSGEGYSVLFEKLIAHKDYQSANLNYSIFLYAISIRFVLMHEIMHVVLGHTSYLQNELGLREYIEFSSSDRMSHDPEFFHCLEFLADRHAIRGIAEKMISRDPRYQVGAEQELIRNATVSRDSYVLRAVMTAPTLLFHLFPYKDGLLEKPITTHPIPYIRAQWICMELGHEFQSSNMFEADILTPMAYTVANLSSNFRCPGNWANATQMDAESSKNGKLQISDIAYERILQLSGKWSSHIYKEYGPKFRSNEGELIP